MTENCRQNRKVAVMQPYFFPYVGYFNLLHACSKLIFLDNAKLNTRGWVCRNAISLQGKRHMFSVPLVGKSQNKDINQHQLFQFDEFRDKFLKTLHLEYSKYDNYPIIEKAIWDVFSNESQRMDQLAITSVKVTCKLLGLNTEFRKASELPLKNDGASASEYIIQIMKYVGATQYVNLPGGRSLYDPVYFKQEGIGIEFILPKEPQYIDTKGTSRQSSGLSILDVLFRMPRSNWGSVLTSYTLD